MGSNFVPIDPIVPIVLATPLNRMLTKCQVLSPINMFFMA
jgi:hypothetical protein